MAAWMLIIGACTSRESVVTVLPPTTRPQTSTTTTAPRTVTPTTIPDQGVEVSFDGVDEVAEVVSSLYTWLADREARMPDLPEGLATHLEPRIPTEEGPLSGAFFFEQVGDMGKAGVAVVEDDDVILLVDEGRGWRVVGAWFARYGFAPWFGDPIRHVFVIGTDAREWQDPVRFRGDSLHLISSNTAVGGGGILVFPRDSWVETPYGMDKFTHVNAIIWTRSDDQLERDLKALSNDSDFRDTAAALSTGGMKERLRSGPIGGEVTVEVAEQITGIPIEGYILTGFRDFQLLLNDYGSVMVNVPFAMADRSSGAYFAAGVQEMWGRFALAFSRNRHLRGGDFTRSLHQGLVILARLRGVFGSEFSTLPLLTSALVKHTWTDLSLEQLLTLGAGAFLLDPTKIGNEVLPGRVATRSGASVVLLSSSSEELFRDMDDGVLGLDVSDGEIGPAVDLRLKLRSRWRGPGRSGLRRRPENSHRAPQG